MLDNRPVSYHPTSNFKLDPKSPQQRSAKKICDSKSSGCFLPSVENTRKQTSLFNISERSEEISSVFCDAQKSNSEFLAEQAWDYWNKTKGLKNHRRCTKSGKPFENYLETIDKLKKLFAGTLFTYSSDRGLQKLAGKKYTLDEIKIAIDNVHLSLTNYAFYPANKKKIQQQYQKSISFSSWLYNEHSQWDKSLFVKYLVPPKRIEAKSMIKINSEKMLDEFQTLYPEKLQPAILDQVKQALNKLYEIWKKIPDHFTHTTLPDNLGQREMVRILFDFAKDIAQYFNPRLLSQPWFWTKFDNFLIEQGYFEE